MEKREDLPEADSTFLRWAAVEPNWLTETELEKAHRLDPHIMSILIAVEGKRPDFQDIVEFGPITGCLWLQFKSLVIHDGLLFRRFETPSGLPNLHR